MNERRSPFDGQPYYCTFCGSGLGEYYACDDVRCVLESAEAAKARKQSKNQPTPDRGGKP
jgi:hypothetical protein